MQGSSDPHELTTLLIDWREGSRTAGDRLFEATYAELRRLAAHYISGERTGHTLQPTAVVHELYLRLFGSEPVRWQDRAHFFAVAAQQFRRILIDHARKRHADKREGDRQRVPLTEASDLAAHTDEELIALDDALSRLQELDDRPARVVELRYFGGLTEQEIAGTLGISVPTVKRDWQFARAWLKTSMAPAEEP
jgi:RNA polymerase sigma factor (TIGR02999 family)